MFMVFRANQFLGSFPVETTVVGKVAQIDGEHLFTPDDATCYCSEAMVVVLRKGVLPELTADTTTVVDMSTLSDYVTDAMDKALAA